MVSQFGPKDRQRYYALSLIGQLAYVTQVPGTQCVDIDQVVVRVARRCVGSGVKRPRLRLVQSHLQPSSLLARQRQVCNVRGTRLVYALFHSSSYPFHLHGWLYRQPN